jgi:signal transduction histidine kinase
VSAVAQSKGLVERSAAPLASLRVRLAWLTALRLVVLTLVLVVTGTVYMGGFAMGGFSSKLVLFTVAVAYSVAALYAVLLRWGQRLRVVTLAQLITDQITWTIIVYVSGGAASGATSLYGLTCLSGAILLGRSGALAAAFAAITAYGLLCVGFGVRLLAPPPDQTVDAYVIRWADMAYPAFVNVLGLVVVALLASYLAERLRATGGRLVAATARADEAEPLAMLGRLAAALAHEIRNPLGAIAGSVELLRTGGTLSDEDQKLCALVERETSRLNDLVTDMLDLSRPRAPARVQHDLAATAREVVMLASKAGRGGDITLHYDGPDSVLVWADAAQMRQVVWNLVRNAVQASRPGGSVEVRLNEDSSAAVLVVADTGVGIPAEARANLFNAFFTTRTHGVGIGLAVVKRVVEAHDFSIDVESSEGTGTTFRVRMPKAAAREPHGQLGETESGPARLRATAAADER